MSELGILAELIKLCRATLTNSCSYIKIEKNHSEPFDTLRGFRQGDHISCDHFNIVLRKVVVNCNGTIFNKSVQLLAYGDDIDIISRTKCDVSDVTYLCLGLNSPLSYYYY